MSNAKPLNRKAYGSIGHLPHSRMGIGDHKVPDGMSDIIHARARDRFDTIIIQEKLDGSNCAVCKVDGSILALSRSGYLAETSPYQQHHLFSNWVSKNEDRFDALLDEGERVVGEWLIQAVGTRYHLPHEPFVPFDIMSGDDRVPYDIFSVRVIQNGFTIPRLISYGAPVSHAWILKRLEPSGHGALDPVEGYVCRVERNKKVDFLAKWVRPDKVDGKFFANDNFIVNTYPDQDLQRKKSSSKIVVLCSVTCTTQMKTLSFLSCRT